MVPVRKPRGYWGIILALGLALACWSGQAQEQKPETTGRAEQTHESAPNPPSVGLPVQLIESPAEAEARKRAEQQSERREIADLVAQRGMNLAAQAMNDATQRMAQYAFWSTVIVAVGTALLFWTLWETRKATKAANDAVMVTREIGEAQVRAYVHVEAVELFWGDPQGTRPRIIALIANTGQSPARWFEVSSTVFTRKLRENGTPDDAVVFSDIAIPSGGTRWNALGSNSLLSATILRANNIEVVRAIYGQKDVSLNVAGFVKYETFFGERFISEFWFMMRPIPSFDYTTKGPRVAGLATSRAIETPHKFARSTASLKSYERESG